MKTNKRKLELGFSTLEIMLAVFIGVLVLSSVILVSFGNQSLAVDSETNIEAQAKAKEILEKAIQASRQNYSGVLPEVGTYVSGITYNTELSFPSQFVTQCSKQAVSTVSWTGQNGRPQKVELKSKITNFPEIFALGYNCDTSPPPSFGWNPPETWNCDNFNPGKATGIDALNQIVYMTSDKVPYFYIADTRNIPRNENCSPSGLFVDFENNFSAGAELNDVRVARLSDGEIYAFVARNTTSNQFQVIRVTDMLNPVSVGIFQLAGVNSAGAYPQAWRIFYYDNKVYVTTRFTSGPELHVFDVSIPSRITEIGTGTDLEKTVNNFVVTKKNISGTNYTFLFMATSDNNQELFVLNATNPSAITEVVGASRNLINPDYADGNTVFLLGNYLFFGRDSGSPDDLFIFDATNPLAAVGGLPIINQVDIGTSVIALVVSGPYTFMATTKANAEFQVWTSDPTQPITKVDTTNFNFPNIITFGNGLKQEGGWVYLASQANDALRILYDGQ